MRLFPSRVEKELDKDSWGLWRWYDIIIGGQLYLTRLTLFKCPWFSIKLHWIHKADPDRDMHTHPWNFVSFVLRGGYNEIMSEYPKIIDDKERSIKWFNKMNTISAHRIISVMPNTITLVITGAKQKDWGFWVADGDDRRYIDYREYIKINQQ